MPKTTSNLYVIGATGYIGRALFDGAKKVNTTYGTSSCEVNEFHSLHLGSPLDFDYGKITACDTIFLTAAISAPDICAREYDLAWSVNVAGTSIFISRVIERGGRVIFFSSDTVYGEQDKAFDEQAPCQPAGEYAIMKHEVEQRFAGHPNFKAIRLSYVFSREDKFTRYLAGCAQKNEMAELFHPFCRSIVHRADVVTGALALAQKWDETPEQIINFGGPAVLSRVEFAECLRTVYLHNLRFRVTEPDDEFFRNRPRLISMDSPVFARLLERSPHTLYEAAHVEFELPSNHGLEE